MPTSSAVEVARARLLAEFRWHGGHADIWRMFVNATALSSVIDGLAEPWRDKGITHVLGIESRGFLLGGAVAVSLGAESVYAVRSGLPLAFASTAHASRSSPR